MLSFSLNVLVNEQSSFEIYNNILEKNVTFHKFDNFINVSINISNKLKIFKKRGIDMKITLARLHIKNFRGYRDATIAFDENMNVIIGRNDIGKSTVLEALEIFFNNEQIKIDVGDKNIKSNDSEKIEISCSFSVDDDAKIIIDSSVPVDLGEEYLLNDNNELEINKVWDCSKKTIGAKDLKIFIKAKYPVLECGTLVGEKLSSLKSILKGCVSKEIYDEVDKTKSSEVRKAIYLSQVNADTSFVINDIDVTADGMKDIWKSLQGSLPLYFLFKSDRLNSDKDSEVQTPMKVVTKSVIADLQEEIDSIINTVREKVEFIGKETLQKLSDLDPEIASRLSPEIHTKSLDTIFSFDLISDDGIPLNKRGSGVRRLILLSYFRAEAEKSIKDSHNQSVIYAIEEPETAQHPNYQRMIMESLLELANDKKHQIIVTTHNPEVAKLVDLNQLIFIYRDNDGNPVFEEKDEVKIPSIIETLGILPYAVEQCVICVEGENDVSFINNINKIDEFRQIIDLEALKIRIVPLQGSNLIRWVNENYFSESNIKEIHLYDNDRQDYRNIVSKIKAENDKRRYGFLTMRREMENYIPPLLIEREFGIDLSEYYSSWNEIDVPETLKNMAMLNVKDPKDREKTIKNILNGKVVKSITVEDLRNMENFEEVESFFKKVRDIINGTYIEK